MVFEISFLPKRPIKIAEAKDFTVFSQLTCWNNTPENKISTVGKITSWRSKNLLTKKRRVRKKWQITRSRKDKTILNLLPQKLKRVINHIKNETLEYYLLELIYEADTHWINRAKSSKKNDDAFVESLEKSFQPKLIIGRSRRLTSLLQEKYH